MISGAAHLGLGLAGVGRHEEALAAFEQAVTQGATFEVEPRFTGRATAMWAGVLRELFEIEEARRLNEHAIALGEEARFPGSQVSGKIDLLLLDVIAGEVGRAESAWPSLWEAAAQTKGWHQWLWTTRLLHAKAEIALGAGRAEQALDAALEALATAERYRRRKYVQASRLSLGRALHNLGRIEEALAELGRALPGAQELAHPPTIWSTASLSRVCARMRMTTMAPTKHTGWRGARSTSSQPVFPRRDESVSSPPPTSRPRSLSPAERAVQTVPAIGRRGASGPP